MKGQISGYNPSHPEPVALVWVREQTELSLGEGKDSNLMGVFSSLNRLKFKKHGAGCKG